MYLGPRFNIMHGLDGFRIKSAGGRSWNSQTDEGPRPLGIESWTIIETGATLPTRQTSRLCANEPF